MQDEMELGMKSKILTLINALLWKSGDLFVLCIQFVTHLMADVEGGNGEEA